MEEHSIVPATLRREREKKALSRYDLAALVGCDSRTIARWELGEVSPRPFYRQKLMEIFGKDAEELGFIDGRDEKPSQRLLREKERKTEELGQENYNRVRDLVQEIIHKESLPRESARGKQERRVDWTPIIIATIWLALMTIPLVSLIWLSAQKENLTANLILIALIIGTDIGPFQILIKTANSYIPSQTRDGGSVLLDVLKALLDLLRKGRRITKETHPSLPVNEARSSLFVNERFTNPPASSDSDRGSSFFSTH